jgi:hypothetical protein
MPLRGNHRQWDHDDWGEHDPLQVAEPPLANGGKSGDFDHGDT